MPPVKPLCWYLGVDPGNKGSASLIDSTGQPLVRDGEIVSCRFDKYTPHGIAMFLERVHSLVTAEYHPPTLKIMLEHVWAFQSGKGSNPQMFKFGKAAGLVEGMLSLLKVQYGYSLDKVTPTKWQTAMGCLSGGVKTVTRLAAHKLWPEYAKQITNDNADSLLIAEYARLHLG